MSLNSKIAWSSYYREPALLNAALKIYTKSLFNRPHASQFSIDGRTLYDFSRRGPKNLANLHRSLLNEKFSYRPGFALHYNFRGKHRTFYFYPWEERIVDALLFQILGKIFHPFFSSSSYAYRLGGMNLNTCQRKVGRILMKEKGPWYLIQQDIQNYFPSIDHGILIRQLENFFDPRDYFFQLLKQRIAFRYEDRGKLFQADRGIPFGCAIACFFANFYLHPLDEKITAIPNLHYFRYSDDLLVLSQDFETGKAASKILTDTVTSLNLTLRSSRLWEGYLSTERSLNPSIDRFRYLGLEFRANGVHGLSKEKTRKIQNLFRYAFRRHKKKLARIQDLQKRMLFLIRISEDVIGQGVRNVAILDYYLTHTQDERQLRELDLWLAQEVLAQILQTGHRKGNFRIICYKTLRRAGLPSLCHRARLLRHHRVESSFFIWRESLRKNRIERGGCQGSKGLFLETRKQESKITL